VENYLPGKLDSWGLGYSDLSKVTLKLPWLSRRWNVMLCIFNIFKDSKNIFRGQISKAFIIEHNNNANYTSHELNSIGVLPK
jgi:hypothetical protein